MSTSRNPFDDLERLFDRMSRQFDDRSRLTDGNGPLARFAPEMEAMPIDLVDRDDEFVATVDLPGFEREDVDIEVTDDELRINAEHESVLDEEDDDGRYLRHERRTTSTRRSIHLPEPIDRDDVHARMTNGVLIVTLPKRELPAGRQIEIESA